jgi:hypothetical protein
MRKRAGQPFSGQAGNRRGWFVVMQFEGDKIARPRDEGAGVALDGQGAAWLSDEAALLYRAMLQPSFRSRARLGVFVGILLAAAPFAAYGQPAYPTRFSPELAKNPSVSQALAFFDALGVRPALGRAYTTAEDLGGSTVIVLGHEFWQHRLAGRSDVIGLTLTTDRGPTTVVGVMPAGFTMVGERTTGA